MGSGKLIIGALLFVLLYIIRRYAARPSDFLETCEDLVRKVPIREYNSIREFASGEMVDYGRLWKQSDGIAGLVRRIRTARNYQKIVQAFYKAGRLSKEDGRYISGQICLLIWFSCRAAGETAICCIFSSYPRLAAHASIQIYGHIALITNTLCLIDDAPECIISMRKLL